ncbi:PilW family protein [Leucobacter denitrificans]|uniref:Prepilin-type N-terminal cleavage/methylation domain-containing protein n=1 Tax=Leucobacter denitrificans TaxID=683042 RepID=A0A7G9S7D4_9MICO|nr:prepilin-type N-terminal cleavage/methylation domain-containing protein [Leucobacter denitrificans]QNN63759.1 prepilin-type N-terminal cleavage/methylation domain-containing protein [Leucobacter denitrificans]
MKLRIMRGLRRDDGISLVELSVTMVVLGIIALIVSTFMVSIFRSEQAVQGISASSNDSQVVTLAIADDMRNARSFITTPTSVTASVSTSQAQMGWECVRWEIDPASGKLVRERWPDGAQSGARMAAAPASGVLAQGVGAFGTEDFFTGGSSSTASGSTTGTLEYRFTIATSDEHSIDVAGQVTNRLSSAGTSCWEGA